MEQPAPVSGLKVSNLMSANLITIEEYDPVSFVIQVFDRCHISGAPVVNDQGEYIGVISKTDLFDKTLLDFLKHGSLDDLPVRYIMNPTPPVCVPDHTSAEKAAELMLRNRIHRVFITDAENKIVGVVSSYDILRVVAIGQNNGATSQAAQKEQQILHLRDQLQKSKHTTIQQKKSG